MTDRKPGFEEAVEAGLRKLQKEVRTFVPATVVSYTPATMRALVQPAPSLVTRGREARPLPPVSVPVVFPGAAGFRMIWPIVPGDRVILACADRSIDRWLSGEPVGAPKSGRMHQLTDAFALPMSPGVNGEAADLVIEGPTGPGVRLSALGALTLAEGLTEAAAARVGDEVAVSEGLAAWMGAVTTFINTASPGTISGVPTTAGDIATGSTRVSIG